MSVVVFVSHRFEDHALRRRRILDDPHVAPIAMPENAFGFREFVQQVAVGKLCLLPRKAKFAVFRFDLRHVQVIGVANFALSRRVAHMRDVTVFRGKVGAVVVVNNAWFPSSSGDRRDTLVGFWDLTGSKSSRR